MPAQNWYIKVIWRNLSGGNVIFFTHFPDVSYNYINSTNLPFIGDTAKEVNLTNNQTIEHLYTIDGNLHSLTNFKAFINNLGTGTVYAFEVATHNNMGADIDITHPLLPSTTFPTPDDHSNITGINFGIQRVEVHFDVNDNYGQYYNFYIDILPTIILNPPKIYRSLTGKNSSTEVYIERIVEKIELRDFSDNPKWILHTTCKNKNNYQFVNYISRVSEVNSSSDGMQFNFFFSSFLKERISFKNGTVKLTRKTVQSTPQDPFISLPLLDWGTSGNNKGKYNNDSVLIRNTSYWAYSSFTNAQLLYISNNGGNTIDVDIVLNYEIYNLFITVVNESTQEIKYIDSSFPSSQYLLRDGTKLNHFIDKTFTLVLPTNYTSVKYKLDGGNFITPTSSNELLTIDKDTLLEIYDA